MNSKKLRKDIERRLEKWNERSVFKFSGVKGVTRADMDTLLMCCNYYDEHGSLYGLSYFSPEVKQVLVVYGALELLRKDDHYVR